MSVLSGITMAVALLPTIVIMLIVIKNARAAREPFCKLALVFGISALSVIPAGILEVFGDPVLTSLLSAVGINSSDGENAQAIISFLQFVLIVGGAEEACKYFTFKLMIFNDRDFDNTYDGVIYGACSALGFATVENLMYVFVSSGGASLGTAVLRAVLSVPLHAFTGIYMGYYFGITKYRRYNNLPDTHPERRAFLLSVVIHGVYDFLASVPGIYYRSSGIVLLALGLLAIVMIIIYALMAKTIKKAKREMHHIYNRYYYEYLGGQFQDLRGSKTTSDSLYIPPPQNFNGAGMPGGQGQGQFRVGVPPTNGSYVPYQPQPPQDPMYGNNAAPQPSQSQYRQYMPASAPHQPSQQPVRQPPVRQYKYCGSCGARHALTVKYCSMCGSKV